MNLQRRSFSVPGNRRHLDVDVYQHRSPCRKAVIMTTAFIESGYWFQIEKSGYSLAEVVAAMGFDVYVLSFPIHWEASFCSDGEK